MGHCCCCSSGAPDCTLSLTSSCLDASQQPLHASSATRSCRYTKSKSDGGTCSTPSIASGARPTRCSSWSWLEVKRPPASLLLRDVHGVAAACATLRLLPQLPKGTAAAFPADTAAPDRGAGWFQWWWQQPAAEPAAAAAAAAAAPRLGEMRSKRVWHHPGAFPTVAAPRLGIVCMCTGV